MSLAFTPLKSQITSDFWLKLMRHKLEVAKLDSHPLPILGYIRPGSGVVEYLEDSLILDDTEEEADAVVMRNECVAFKGNIKLVNTRESFKSCNKNEYLKDNRLTDCTILTFADLKSHAIVYWPAYPTCPGVITEGGECQPPSFLEEKEMTYDGEGEELSEFDSAYDDLRRRVKGYAPHHFYAFKSPSGELRMDLLSSITPEDLSDQSVRFGCINTSPQRANPWTLRTLLTSLQSLDIASKTIDVVIYSPTLRRLEIKDGLYVRDEELGKTSTSRVLKISTCDWIKVSPETLEGVGMVGWELNNKNKPGPRSVNLKANMDQESLAEQSAQLNLKLMRWRVIPELDTDMLEKTSCLILGSGTLGCQVARNLMSWGVRKITFLDSGRVSMSNPVRQSLYTFEDSKDGGKFKAERAGEACKEIFPGMDCKGVVMSIPMPGHPISSLSASEVKEDTAKLHDLIKSHDVIYLLTDTRESRWLPTVMAASEGKILINVALGFSSWLVMRHGKGVKKEEGQLQSSEKNHEKCLEQDEDRLGCYFCADVVAPANSMRDRTLDQQCTVTRPGLAPIASAMGVEMMVALLHRNSKDSSALGQIPHMIRGDLGDWSVANIKTPSFNCCTGCSEKVVKKWREDGFGLVEKVCEDEKYLEDLTGLTELKTQAEEVDWDIDDDEEDF